MKAEIKFANTSNGPKAFVKTFDDDWTPMSTPLKAYKKDMRSIKPAGNYEEGKDYMVAVSPWVLEAFLKANQIDYVQLIRGQDLKNPPVGSIRYANEKEVVWYEYSSATTTRRCTDLSRAKSFVQEWVNLDCPTLKRFSTNQKVLSVNGFGAAVPLFESPLVDTSYVDTVIADDIEDKEIEGLRKHLNPDGVISQLLNNVQKARAEKASMKWKAASSRSKPRFAFSCALRKSKTKSKTSKLLISMRRAALTVVSFSGIRKLILSSKRT